MDNYIKQSIEARKQAISANYEPSDAMKKKIEELFNEINELGKSCKDVGEFETKFASSPLNQKYLDLFTEVATSAQAMASKKAIDEATQGGVVDEIKNRTMSNIKLTVSPTRAAVRQKGYDVARRIPGIGDALHVKNQVDTVRHFGRMLGIRKKKSDEEE